jgi:hypothetical protein
MNYIMVGEQFTGNQQTNAGRVRRKFAEYGKLRHWSDVVCNKLVRGIRPPTEKEIRVRTE